MKRIVKPAVKFEPQLVKDVSPWDNESCDGKSTSCFGQGFCILGCNGDETAITFRPLHIWV
ncbi:hypothetical protein J6590_017543 [Homalodisca vitripennis]|nr:hypothetical protein J6590_017543 [Homalodisca vitripennis]